jgi:hypothetical protein
MRREVLVGLGLPRHHRKVEGSIPLQKNMTYAGLCQFFFHVLLFSSTQYQRPTSVSLFIAPLLVTLSTINACLIQTVRFTSLGVFKIKKGVDGTSATLRRVTGALSRRPRLLERLRLLTEAYLSLYQNTLLGGNASWYLKGDYFIAHTILHHFLYESLFGVFY